MKTLLYIFTFLFLAPSLTEKEVIASVEWQTDYNSVLKQAKKDKKNVLIYFTGSDWCPPCKMLKKDLFETDAFKELSEEYVLLYVDIPRNKDILTAEQYSKNKSLLPKYNKKGVFPLMAVVSSNGVLLDDYSGYSMNGEVRYHLDFLKKNK
ncbi:thioredoxin family protein [uncultured Croceitalea sp.]|uniref:thioredoxin family protein n=1 Tax=uncultured Croceitalea sp. TaxID=1798908 RepID=UPI00330684C8